MVSAIGALIVGIVGVVAVGSGVFSGLGKSVSDFANDLKGGGGGASTETSNTVIDFGGSGEPIPENTGEFSLPAVAVGNGSVVIPTPAINNANVTQKSQESLFRFRETQDQQSLEDRVGFFRLLQQQQLSQTSLGTSVILSEEDITRVVSQQFSKQELSDAEALDKRKQDSAFANFKLSGADTVQAKRLEAERARLGVFDSSSVQNPNFNLGLPSNATKADIDLAIRQQNENRARQITIAENKIKSETNIAVGQAIIDFTGADTIQEQKSLFTGLNINSGSALNAKTLGRLQELGLI